MDKVVKRRRRLYFVNEEGLGLDKLPLVKSGEVLPRQTLPRVYRLRAPVIQKQVEFKVRCGGRMHKIILTKRGRLVLCDHQDKNASNAVAVQAALGGPKLKCPDVLAAWKDGGYAHPALNEFAWPARNAKKSDRGYATTQQLEVPTGRKHKHVTYDPLASGNSATREADNTLGAARSAFNSAHYKYREQGYKLKPTFLIGTPARISTSTTWKPGGDGKVTIYCEIRVPLKWHRKAFCVADGHLVMELSEATQSGKVVSHDAQLLRVIKTKRGPVPVICKARLYKKGRGWVISWTSWKVSPPTLPTHIKFD
jgi:hypothetical protein